jgi:hypothetical protein
MCEIRVTNVNRVALVMNGTLGQILELPWRSIAVVSQRIGGTLDRDRRAFMRGNGS